MNKAHFPLVYSCSGCSSAAQTANIIAIRMDRDKIAEMSCIAGVGGDVFPLVKTAKSGREIIAIDGCPLSCVKSCLARHDVEPKYHFVLTDFQIVKKQGEDPDPQEAMNVYHELLKRIKMIEISPDTI